jgi:hypothetical protein
MPAGLPEDLAGKKLLCDLKEKKARLSSSGQQEYEPTETLYLLRLLGAAFTSGIYVYNRAINPNL